MSITENFARSGSYNLFYRSAGTNGPAVVLIHGIPTNSYLWQGIIPHVSNSYFVIAPDQLGYGNSDRGPVEELTLPQQARHILSLLDTLGIEKAHFIGHDLGGGIAQILAVNYPERVESLIIADGVCFSNWPVPLVVAMRWPTITDFEPSMTLVQEMLRLGIYNPNMITPDIMEAFISPFAGQEGFEALQRASMALEHHQTEELVPSLSQIQVPTTILWGQYDRLLPPYWGLRLSEKIPYSTLRVLPYCGHFLMLDNPMLFLNEVTNHLDAVSGMNKTIYNVDYADYSF